MTVLALLVVGATLALFVGGPLARIALALEKQNAHYGVGQPDDEDEDPADPAPPA